MPELPEVELISRSLNALVAGRRIVDARLLRERLAPETSPAEFAGQLANSTINYVGRRGKNILFDLDNNRTLIVHLRMSGRFLLLAGERESPKFTHAVFVFSDDKRLVFDDQRHFGLMKIVFTDKLHESKELTRLAPEPLSDNFTLTYFRAALASSRRSLKEFLLDQTKVCGLGNIYAAEAMFAARIDPRTVANKVSRPNATRLFDSIRAVFEEAINHSASRIVDPENLEGSYFSGGNPEGWHVYGRENEPCVKCQNPIARIKQGGRSTFYCKKCQQS